MRSVILHCPHLGRDISELRRRVPEAIVMLGEPTPRGEDGCLDMHVQAIRDAKAVGASAVFVMEDDCEFTSHFSVERWEVDVELTRLKGYDVLVGASVQVYSPKVVTNNLIEMSAFHSAHCIAYLESGYDKIINGARQPWDVWVGESGARCLLAYPFVAVQRPSFSGILRKPVNYVPLYQQYEGHLGRAVGLCR